MNIFYLHKNPERAAEMHCDKHVVKMILETAQLMSTAHRFLDGDRYADKNGLYKLTHKNHPTAIWVRKSKENYMWTWNLLDALLQEYTKRYNKHHATGRLHEPLFKCPDNIEHNLSFSDPPLCMPEEYKTDDAIESYRNYYINDKASFATWKVSPTPEWFNEQRKSI